MTARPPSLALPSACLLLYTDEHVVNCEFLGDLSEHYERWVCVVLLWLFAGRAVHFWHCMRLMVQIAHAFPSFGYHFYPNYFTSLLTGLHQSLSQLQAI
jgi:hypothetical protein